MNGFGCGCESCLLQSSEPTEEGEVEGERVWTVGGDGTYRMDPIEFAQMIESASIPFFPFSIFLLPVARVSISSRVSFCVGVGVGVGVGVWFLLGYFSKNAGSTLAQISNNGLPIPKRA